MIRFLQIALSGFFLFSHSLLWSQESPQPGYILLDNGSRQEGWIARPSADSRFAQVAFGETSMSKPTILGPDKLLEYGIDQGEKYISSRSVASINEKFGEPVFLQVITEGKLTLLVTEGPVYSLLKDQEEYKILRNAELEPTDPTGISEADYKGERTQNTGIMVQMMAECVPVASKLSSGEYPFEQNARLLANIVNDYNDCQGVEYEDYLAARKKIAIQPFAGVGISINKPWENRASRSAVTGGPYPVNYLYPYENSTLYQAGVDIWFPFLWDQLALSLRGTYGTYQYEGSYYGAVFEGSFDTVSSTLFHEYSTLEFSPAIKVILAQGIKISPYAALGAVFRQNTQISSYTHSVRFTGEKPPITDTQVRTRENTIGVSWVAGCRIPLPMEWPVRLGIEYRGILSNHTVNVDVQPLMSSNIQEHTFSLILSSRPF